MLAGPLISTALGGLFGGAGSKGGGTQEIINTPWAGLIPYLTGGEDGNAGVIPGQPPMSADASYWNTMSGFGHLMGPPPPMFVDDPRFTGENMYMPPETWPDMWPTLAAGMPGFGIGEYNPAAPGGEIGGHPGGPTYPSAGGGNPVDVGGQAPPDQGGGNLDLALMQRAEEMMRMRDQQNQFNYGSSDDPYGGTNWTLGQAMETTQKYDLTPEEQFKLAATLGPGQNASDDLIKRILGR